MDSQEQRNKTRLLWDVYQESCKDLEEKQLLSVLDLLALQSSSKLRLDILSDYSMLSVKMLCSLVKKYSYFFIAKVPESKRHDYESQDISIFISDDGLRYLKQKKIIRKN